MMYEEGRDTIRIPRQLSLIIGLVMLVVISLLHSERAVRLAEAALEEHQVVVHSTTSTSASSTTTSNSASSSCLSLDLDDGGMDRLLSKYKHVLFGGPAKSAGSSMSAFTRHCMKEAGTEIFSNIGTLADLEKVFTSDYEMPSLITNHFHINKSLCQVMKHVTSDTLIVYSHRQETSRMMSGVKQVVTLACQRKNMELISFVDDECQIDEGTLVQEIKAKKGEIGFGMEKLLTCEAYECIKETNPNLVFMNYNQVNRLQTLLAKHHCPGVENLNSNIGSEKKPVSVVLQEETPSGQKVVSLSDWLTTKGSHLEMALWMKENVSCQGTTSAIEHELSACPDEVLQISGYSSENQMVQFPFL